MRILTVCSREGCYCLPGAWRGRALLCYEGGDNWLGLGSNCLYFDWELQLREAAVQPGFVREQFRLPAAAAASLPSLPAANTQAGLKVSQHLKSKVQQAVLYFCSDTSFLQLNVKIPYNKQ